MRTLLLTTLILTACNSNSQENQPVEKKQDTNPKTESVDQRAYVNEHDTTKHIIHVFVALCDNGNQGIVPVSKKLGNGQDPFNNLYWGAAYGIKSYFKRSSEWKLLSSQKHSDTILDRAVFKHSSKDWYLIADAYNGKFIKTTTDDFLSSSAGLTKDTLHIEGDTLGINGNAELLAYIGHDGLMDFGISKKYKNVDEVERETIILACYSKSYFAPHLKYSRANPLVWTTGLMAPEAYTLHDAISGYINGEENNSIRERAAAAYSKYQKCSMNAARNLLVTGW